LEENLANMPFNRSPSTTLPMRTEREYAREINQPAFIYANFINHMATIFLIKAQILWKFDLNIFEH